MHIPSLIRILALVKLLVLNQVSGQINTNIKQIIILIRHGASAPTQTYPTDNYGESYWNNLGGLGFITSNGLLQTYRLGQSLKNYYSNFLSPIYNADKVYARSIDIDRSIMSLNTFMAGMYPPAERNQLWSPSVTWYPIPTHTGDFNDQGIKIFNTNRNCSQYDNLINQSLNSQNYSQTAVRYSNFVANMSILSGIKNADLFGLTPITDSAFSKLANNLPLQQWVIDNYKNLTDLNDYVIDLRYGSDDKARLVSGGLLFDIFENMRAKLNGRSNKEAFVYSCQDYHLSALSTILNMQPIIKQAPFGALYVLELRQDQNGLFYVRVLANNNTINQQGIDMQPVKLENCDILCPWGNFFNLAKDGFVNNITNSCQINSTTPIYTTTNPTTLTSTPNDNNQNRSGFTQLELALIIVSSILAAIIIGLLITLCLVARRGRIKLARF